VPAVAVIRRRLVLFIFNRFKGYLDGKISLKYDTVLLILLIIVYTYIILIFVTETRYRY